EATAGEGLPPDGHGGCAGVWQELATGGAGAVWHSGGALPTGSRQLDRLAAGAHSSASIRNTRPSTRPVTTTPQASGIRMACQSGWPIGSISIQISRPG